MLATITPKTVARNQPTRTAPRTLEKAPTKAPARPGLLTVLLRALSAFAA